jgi:hypothetical protein
VVAYWWTESVVWQLYLEAEVELQQRLGELHHRLRVREIELTIVLYAAVR